MQYLLSEDEFKALTQRAQVGDKAASLKQALATARDHMLEMASYTCVHHREGRYVGYCDGCPCSPLGHDDLETWDVICGQPQAYGK